MMQFEENDIVLYGLNGACKISEIEQREQGDYYILTPVHKDRTKLLVPVDNEALVARMRHVPSPHVVRECIRKAAKAEPKWIDDNSARREHAKDIIARGNEYELLMLARVFHLHKVHVAETGKKSTTSDSNILRSAQDRIRDEFSVVFDIEPEEVDEFIGKQTDAVEHETYRCAPAQ